MPEKSKNIADTRDLRLKYSLSNLQKYVENQYKYYLNSKTAGSEDERRKEAQAHEMLRANALDAHAGLGVDRKAVKQFILSVLIGSMVTGVEEDEMLVLDDTTINYTMDWDDPPVYIKFLGIIYTMMPDHGRGSFKKIIRDYDLSRLRPIAEFRGDDEQLGMMVTEDDISMVFEDMRIYFNDDMKLDIIVQCIYEEFKGNGCIDELLNQDVDDTSIGVSGLPEPIVPEHLIGKGYPSAPDSVWIKYQGASMQLRFLTFTTFENLRRVVDQSIAYQQKGAFSETEGSKLGYGKDGSRRTAVITPFGESPAAWYRQFTVKTATNKELVMGRDRNIGGTDIALKVEKILVCGGATIPICGPQGAGKTTKLGGVGEYIESMFNIRMIESEFEARYRWRYPEKNIFTLQTNMISPEEAYDVSLRTTGDIYILSEVRSDKMLENVIRTSARGGRCVLFTYHPNTPRATIIEAANTLIRLGLFNRLADAMYTVLSAIRACLYIDIDIETGDRHYNIYEFVPVEIPIDNAYQKKTGQERTEAFMDTIYTYMMKTTTSEFFRTVPITQFNRYTNAYELRNNISGTFYDELMMKTYTKVNKDNLEKFFRPMEYIKNNKMYDLTWERAVEEHGLNEKFLAKSQFMDSTVLNQYIDSPTAEREF